MKSTPGPWHACGNGKCACKQVWSPDYPVAKVECGKWGDDYVSIRLTGESLLLKAEPFMDQITYGEISEDVAEANARLIAAAPDLLEVLKTYRESHNTCIKDSPQGLCNKCRMAEEAIAKAEGVEP